MFSEQFIGIMVTADEFENFVRDQHSMEILTEYRQRGLRPSDMLLDVLCGIQKEGKVNVDED